MKIEFAIPKKHYEVFMEKSKSYWFKSTEPLITHINYPQDDSFAGTEFEQEHFKFECEYDEDIYAILNIVEGAVVMCVSPDTAIAKNIPELVYERIPC